MAKGNIQCSMFLFLKQLFMHDDIFSPVVTSHQSQDGMLRDVCDGQYFRNNPLFSSDPPCVALLLMSLPV